MAESEVLGGLDFRDLSSVTDGLLAKQVWRLLKEPNLLMSRVLKAKYFLNQDFFQVTQKNKDSWLWKSWLGAKTVANKGLRWTVGNGKSINIWTDRWIPNAISDKLMSPKLVDCTLSKVHELIDHNRNCCKYQLV